MKRLHLWLIPTAALILLLWTSLFFYYPTEIPISESVKIFFGGADELAQITVLEMRLPRSLVALALGANLAFAGALLQTITRNPLASPSLLSINSGASLAMVCATALFPNFFSDYSVAFIASIGGGLSWFLVMIICGDGSDPSKRNKMILAGVAVSLFCTALTKLVIIVAEDHAANVLSWLAGGVTNVRWQEWRVIFPFLILATIFSAFFAHRLNLLTMSDESAQSLGVNLAQLRFAANVVALLIVGSSVSVAGPVAFIGLLVPHLARFWIGYDNRKALPMTMIFGAALMLMADIVARAVNFPSEVPAGAVLALIGAPIFVLLARGRR